uniref:RWPRK domaincontaining protein putative n=1 Tax=Albugo laibachii Nc14 TaxID=890382 RepID=F0WC11_9STRA|nr:RWPRK domaincontaining protein putative [Albugo laibachii Nc14]|eukprot:CCA18692.1 RWPRK domaincontaining protein putative [Albugo laibachii Nc14]
MSSAGSENEKNEHYTSTIHSDEDRLELQRQYAYAQVQDSGWAMRLKKRRLAQQNEVSDTTRSGIHADQSIWGHLVDDSSTNAESLSVQEEEAHFTGQQLIESVPRMETGAAAAHFITVDMLRPHFDKPLNEVSKIFGICSTLMKKVCRRLHIRKWPYRQILSLRRSIASMKKQVDYFDGERKVIYRDQMHKQQMKLDHLLRTGNALEETNECLQFINSERYDISEYTETTMHSVCEANLTNPPIYGSVATESDIRPILPSISYLLNRQQHNDGSDQADLVPFSLDCDHTF